MYGHSHIYYSLIWTLILRFCFFTFNFRLINKTQFFVWLFKFTLVTQLPEIIQTQKNSENCKINYELIGIIKKVLQQKIISWIYALQFTEYTRYLGHELLYNSTGTNTLLNGRNMLRSRMETKAKVCLLVFRPNLLYTVFSFLLLKLRQKEYQQINKNSINKINKFFDAQTIVNIS